MLSRLPVRSRHAVWLIHPDAEPQLPLMTLANQPVYMPLAVCRTHFGRLLGRPVIPPGVRDGGRSDIMLVDFSQYLAVRGGRGGADVDPSWFDQT